MKILLLGDASNCHRTLAIGLRRLGHDVAVASDGSAWMRTERDIDLRRRHPSRPGGLELWLRLNLLLRNKLQGYDVVSLHNPIFLNLRPHLVQRVFNRVKATNRSVFLTCLGTDTPYVEMALECPPLMRYSEFAIEGQPAPYARNHPDVQLKYLHGAIADHCRYVYDNIDGAVAVLYEYYHSAARWLPANDIAYGGIPIDLQSATPVHIPDHPEKVRLFLGRHSYRQDLKGTDRLEIAARRALERHPGKGELIIVEDRPYKEFVELLQSAHVVIDQAYSYTPATNALLAMANGQVAVSGAEPEYYKFIGEHTNHPIINSPIDVEGMTAMFEDILLHPEQLKMRGQLSREFVKKHNSCEVVASRFANFWQEHLAAKI